MSHIPTSAHGGRAGFDALPQTSGLDVNRAYEGYDRPDVQLDSISQENDYPSYDGSHYGEVRGEDVRPTKYGPNLYSVHTKNISQISGETDVTLSYEKKQGTRPPMLGRDRPNYKPSALRWPFLTTLLVVLLAFIGLMAYAIHSLPAMNADNGMLSRSLHINEFRREMKRQTTGSPSGDGITDTVETITPARGGSGGVSTTTPTTSLITSAVTAAADDYGDVGSKTITEPRTTTSVITSTKASDDYGNVGSTTVTETTVAWSKPTEDFGDVGTVAVTEDPTASKPTEDFGNVGTAIITENHDDGSGVTAKTTEPNPTPTFVAPAVVTLTDERGSATAVSTSTPTPISTPRTTTLTDSAGSATATQTTSVQVEPSISTQTDAAGIPTATITSYPVLPPSASRDDDDDNVVVTEYHISYGQYFIGMFLPSILSILLSLPIRILDLNARAFQPWHALASSSPADGRASLCLQTGGWGAVLRTGAAVRLSTLLALASALLIPLSAEAVAVDVRRGCAAGSGSARGCAYVLAVSARAAWATVGLLALMVGAVAALAAVLVRWRSGLWTNPWSVCGVAALGLNAEVRRVFAGLGGEEKELGEEMKRVLKDRRFGLGYFENTAGGWEYGIVLHGEDRGGVGGLGADADGESNDGEGDGLAVQSRRYDAGASYGNKNTKHHLPFLMLGYTGRLLLLFVLCGLLALILYYNNTGGDTPFERFMDSEAFGVRFLFTGVGVVISFFWSSFFDSIAILSPYHLLSSSPQTARRSILLAPPTNAFSGLWSSIRRRHGFLAVVALTSILSEFLTVFLSNVPYRVNQTFLIHTICTWCAVGIICIMILVVAGSFFVRWPRRMPVDPSTIAGAMYYVCDSYMLNNFSGLSMLGRKERDRRVNQMGFQYEFGEMRGVSGKERVGVDIDGKGYVI
ncbi:hypothetical protein F4810DRAFT_719863 [Camillea tinctor]|nr:hypothetical protein F4810DRAFT_719863 [Camillea tinctor]